MIGARTLVGIALLTRPGAFTTAIAGQQANENVATYARILGARHLLEAAILSRRSTPSVLRTGALVDALHAASALVLVKTSHHHRLATLNVASASAFALVEAKLAPRIG